MRHLHYIIILFFIGFSCIAENYTVSLNNGSKISGDFSVQFNGLLLFSNTGGKVYNWHEIDLETLPKKVKKVATNLLKKDLIHANTAYNSGDIKKAAKLYKSILNRKDLINKKLKNSPIIANIFEKSQGLIIYKNTWIPYSQFLVLKDLKKYKGQLVKKSDFNEVYEFEKSISQAKRSNNTLNSILKFKELQLKYPHSEYTRIITKLIPKLLNSGNLPLQEKTSPEKKHYIKIITIDDVLVEENFSFRRNHHNRKRKMIYFKNTKNGSFRKHKSRARQTSPFQSIRIRN